MPNETEGQAGDSLKIDVSDEGQVTIDWDPNDPQWGWLSALNDEQLQEFVNNALSQLVESSSEDERDGADDL